MHTGFDTSLPLVPCFQGEIKPACLHVITNAAQAISKVMNNDAN
jgi:hypothetical protein